LQAIAELRSALGEDPDRPDLEVLLGKMYWRADQHTDAKDVFTQILEKLPYCLDANRYMAVIFQEEDNTAEAGRYHRHLAALDPYFAFLESTTADPKTIDAKAVRIERSGWVPGQPLPTAESGPPEWVESLGVDLSEAAPTPLEADDAPPWMAEIDQSATPVSTPPAVSADALQTASEDEIPEWMEEAGWVPSSGEVEEAPISFSDAELESIGAGDTKEETGELAPANIPGWVQEIAPEITDDSTDADEPAAVPVGKAEFMPDWLSDIASDAEQITPDPMPPSTVDPLEEAKPILSADPPSVDESAAEDLIAEDDAPEVPTWIDPQAPGATSTIITWLDDRPSRDAEPEKAELPTEAVEKTTEDPLAEADVPSWLDEIAEGDEVPELETKAPDPELESPSWLAGLAEAASQQDLEPEPAVSDETPEKPDEEAAPEWLEGISELEEKPDPVPASDDAPDWLQGIAEPEAVDTAVSPAEDPGTGPPDWVSDAEKAAEEPAVAAAQPQDDVPDWLSGIADSVVERTVDEDFLAETEPEPAEKAVEVPEETPGWLHEFADSAEEIPDPVSKVDEPEIDVQSLQQLEEEIGAHAVDASPPDTLGVSDEVDDDEVFRWLEDLAETQEVEESKPLTPPTERPVEATREPSPTISEAVPPEEAGESLQWLEDLASQRGMDVDVAATIPDVLPAETLVSKPPPVPTEEIDAISDIAPDDETIISAVPQETPQEEPMPEIPGWLDEATSAAEAVPPEPAKETAPPVVKEEILPPEPTPIEAAPVVELPPVPEPIEEVIPPPEAAPPIPAAVKAPQEAEKVEPAAEAAPSKYKEPASQLLQGARQALTAGDAGRALSDYKKLIERKQDLDTVISDLEHALERYPNLPTMWQVLGDAYMKSDKLQEAISAYQRGMEVA
jgi:tetratricopeptide (TPR) repeat protein